MPGHVAVASFVDLPELKFCTPPMTTVDVRLDEVGRQAVDVVLAQLEGEDVPERFVAPARLVLRHSCGCFDPIVLQAAVDPRPASSKLFEKNLVSQRKQILARIESAIEGSKQAPEWGERLFESFMADLETESSGIFLAELDSILRQVMETSDDISRWQDILSALRRNVLPMLNEQHGVSRAENLWQQARLLIAEMIQRIQGKKALQSAQRTQMLYNIGTRLICTFDVQELIEVLTDELPNLNIPQLVCIIL